MPCQNASLFIVKHSPVWRELGRLRPLPVWQALAPQSRASCPDPASQRGLGDGAGFEVRRPMPELPRQLRSWSLRHQDHGIGHRYAGPQALTQQLVLLLTRARNPTAAAPCCTGMSVPLDERPGVVLAIVRTILSPLARARPSDGVRVATPQRRLRLLLRPGLQP